MPYIDKTYYLNEYKGTDASSPDELDRTILRSSEVIDLLTNYIFITGGVKFDSYNEIIKEQVRKATSAMVEHYIVNGGYDAVKQSQNLSGVSSGSFNLSMGNVQEVPDNVYALLYSVGLLYTGIGVQ